MVTHWQRSTIGGTRMHHATPRGLADKVRTMLLLREFPMVTH